MGLLDIGTLGESENDPVGWFSTAHEKDFLLESAAFLDRQSLMDFLVLG